MRAEGGKTGTHQSGRANGGRDTWVRLTRALKPGGGALSALARKHGQATVKIHLKKKKNPAIPFLKSSTKTDSEHKVRCGGHHTARPPAPSGTCSTHKAGFAELPGARPLLAGRGRSAGGGQGARAAGAGPEGGGGRAGLCAFEALPLECSALGLGWAGWWVLVTLHTLFKCLLYFSCANGHCLKLSEGRVQTGTPCRDETRVLVS